MAEQMSVGDTYVGVSHDVVKRHINNMVITFTGSHLALFCLGTICNQHSFISVTVWFLFFCLSAGLWYHGNGYLRRRL